jgi:carbon storage regulator
MMLVLTRKTNEQIVIGENIVVTVVDIRNDRVRLGIEAPREVSIHRREVYEAIRHSHASTSEKQTNLPPKEFT